MNISNLEERKQRQSVRYRTNRKEEEQRLRTEDFRVENILRNDDGDRFDDKNKIKVVTKEKLRVLFITKVENKENILENCTYSNLMNFV